MHLQSAAAFRSYLRTTELRQATYLPIHKSTIRSTRWALPQILHKPSIKHQASMSMRETDNAGTLSHRRHLIQLTTHPPAKHFSQTCHFSCSQTHTFSSYYSFWSWLDVIMMSPLRYIKSSKDFTCHIRSSEYPLSHLPPAQKYSVLLNIWTIDANSVSSVVYRMYTTLHTSSIFRPAASLSYHPP